MPDKVRTVYWSQVYTPKSWHRFLENGGGVTGFRDIRWKHIQTIKPGDLILCYLSGLSQFVAVLRVLSEPYLDLTRIWDEGLFPCRVDVDIVVSVSDSQAVPIRDLSDLSIFRIKNWSLYLVSSPSKWKSEDGRIVLNALRKRVG